MGAKRVRILLASPSNTYHYVGISSLGQTIASHNPQISGFGTEALMINFIPAPINIHKSFLTAISVLILMLYTEPLMLSVNQPMGGRLYDVQLTVEGSGYCN